MRREWKKMGQPLQTGNEKERESERERSPAGWMLFGAAGHWSRGHGNDPQTCSTFDQTAV